MIAEELPKALRAHDDRAKIEQCPREPDFIAMYRCLGDGDEQERIRSLNRNVRHCHYLRRSPDACHVLPDSAGIYAGKICPNNPYENKRNQQFFEDLSSTEDLIDEAFYIGSEVDLGLVTLLSAPERYHAARIMSEYLKIKRATNEQAMIASILASTRVDGNN